MATLDEVGEQDGWQCWLCDEPVDPDRSVNDDRGPSVDGRTTTKKAKKAKSKTAARPRLAHRACTTGKGNVEAVIPWSGELFLIDPVPIIPAAERLSAKGGREIMCRCPTEDDALVATSWIVDRLSRLEPDLDLSSEVQEGGGQYLVIVRA
jgi:hypothetical protein